MNAIDIVILLLLAVFVVSGWRSGFIIVVGKLFSLIAGLIATAYALSWLGDTFGIVWSQHAVWAVLAFLFLAGLVSRLLMLVFRGLNQVWRVISIVPLMGPLNHLLGAVAGLVKGVVVLIGIAYLLNMVPLGQYSDSLTASALLTMLRNTATSLSVLLPM